jgi:hypothetical protein
MLVRSEDARCERRAGLYQSMLRPRIGTGKPQPPATSNPIAISISGLRQLASAKNGPRLACLLPRA